MDDKLIAARRDKVEILAGAHAIAADMYATRHRQISIPTIILSTILGTMTLSGFVELHQTAKLVVDIAICILAITVAVLTALQTFFDYASRSQAHSDAAAKLFALGQKWELLFNRSPDMEEVGSLDETLAQLIQRIPRVSIKLQKEAMERHAQVERILPEDNLYRSVRTFIMREPTELEKRLGNGLV